MKYQHIKQWYLLGVLSACELTIHMWFILFLVDPGVAGHWTAAPQTVLPKPFRKGCLGYAKSDALKLRCEIKLSQSTGNQFTRWKNTRGRCLEYFIFIFWEDTVVTFLVSGLLTPKLKQWICIGWKINVLMLLSNLKLEKWIWRIKLYITTGKTLSTGRSKYMLLWGSNHKRGLFQAPDGSCQRPSWASLSQQSKKPTEGLSSSLWRVGVAGNGDAWVLDCGGGAAGGV